MGGLLSKPKVDKSAQYAAEASARKAEKEAAQAKKQSEMDSEYRRTKQRGKNSTLISVDDTATKSLLGGN